MEPAITPSHDSHKYTHTARTQTHTQAIYSISTNIITPPVELVASNAITRAYRTWIWEKYKRNGNLFVLLRLLLITTSFRFHFGDFRISHTMVCVCRSACTRLKYHRKSAYRVSHASMSRRQTTVPCTHSTHSNWISRKHSNCLAHCAVRSTRSIRVFASSRDGENEKWRNWRCVHLPDNSSVWGRGVGECAKCIYVSQFRLGAPMHSPIHTFASFAMLFNACRLHSFQWYSCCCKHLCYYICWSTSYADPRLCIFHQLL